MSEFIRQVFSLLSRSIFQPDGERTFEEIIGHNDTKLILNKAILSKKPVNVLLLGKPGCAKTMFLNEIMKSFKQSLFIVGSNTTKAGLLNQLFETRPKFLLIDELEKMGTVDQTSLLHLMETGIISETKYRKVRQMELTTWLFATANSSEKIIEPLLSRFFVLKIPSYSFEEFIEISVIRLAKEGVNNSIAEMIAKNLWNKGSTDLRDVIKVARLANSTDEVPFIVRMMNR